MTNPRPLLCAARNRPITNRMDPNLKGRALPISRTSFRWSIPQTWEIFQFSCKENVQRPNGKSQSEPTNEYVPRLNTTHFLSVLNSWYFYIQNHSLRMPSYKSLAQPSSIYYSLFAFGPRKQIQVRRYDVLTNSMRFICISERKKWINTPRMAY